jgi:hypothetical protein
MFSRRTYARDRGAQRKRNGRHLVPRDTRLYFPDGISKDAQRNHVTEADCGARTLHSAPQTTVHAALQELALAKRSIPYFLHNSAKILHDRPVKLRANQAAGWDHAEARNDFSKYAALA